MKTMQKSSNRSAATPKISGSLSEQLSSFSRDFKKQALKQGVLAGQTAFNSLLGKYPPMERGANRLATPERFWQRQVQKRERPQEIKIFAFREHQERNRIAEQIKNLVYEIKREIKLIEQKNKMMITEASKITVQTLPTKPGVYHVRFFEWLLGMLRDIRKKVTESGDWLKTARGKKRKMGYWASVKKHGTKFALSGERTPATQTG